MPGLSLTQSPVQQQRQEQRLSYQQYQGLDVLQMPLLDLQQRVTTELQQNPFLEQLNQPLVVNESDLRQGQDLPPTAEELRAERDFDAEREEYLAEVFANDAERHLRPLTREDLKDMSPGKDGLPGVREYSAVAHDPDAEERRQYLFDSKTAEGEGLYTTLLRQVAELKITPEMRRLVATLLVDHLNDAGYLCGFRFIPRAEKSRKSKEEELQIEEYEISDEELAAEYHITPGIVQKAVQLAQSLEPPGICARNLRECLLLQLKAQGLVHSLEWDIIGKFWEDLKESQIPEARLAQMAQAIEADVDETKEAIDRIRRLNRTPGYDVDFEQAHYIYPEVIVDREKDGGFSIRSATDVVPQLRIAPEYRNLVPEKKKAGENPKDEGTMDAEPPEDYDDDLFEDTDDEEELEKEEEPAEDIDEEEAAGEDAEAEEAEEPAPLTLEDFHTAEERKWMREKASRANQLIEMIGAREKTIVRVTEVIVDFQRKYFTTGNEEDIRPLTLEQVAQKIHNNESTVSRAISEKDKKGNTRDKYLRDPWGQLKPFKLFFPRGSKSVDGQTKDVSTLTVRKRLREFVEEEDKLKPYTDEQLSAMLKREGYKVELRTVNKYRREEGIPVASKRKVH